MFCDDSDMKWGKLRSSFRYSFFMTDGHLLFSESSQIPLKIYQRGIEHTEVKGHENPEWSKNVSGSDLKETFDHLLFTELKFLFSGVFSKFSALVNKFYNTLNFSLNVFIILSDFDVINVNDKNIFTLKEISLFSLKFMKKSGNFLTSVESNKSHGLINNDTDQRSRDLSVFLTVSSSLFYPLKFVWKNQTHDIKGKVLLNSLHSAGLHRPKLHLQN